jgi:cyclopropane-fatty-acyl-phospholipid synthase|tara:strand:+ start:3638 stop:4843 length:1206 start_codon:yes stop_codon:yes gene_type:complete
MNIKKIINLKIRNKLITKFKPFSYYKINFTDLWGNWIIGNGDKSINVKIINPDFYLMLFSSGSNGIANAYIRGFWECDDLYELFRGFVKNIKLIDTFETGYLKFGILKNRLVHFFSSNSKLGSKKNIQAHYDLGNDFFKLFLDDTMTYSSAIFESRNSSLKEASINKLDLICKKLNLNETDHVLEIGGGWGSFAIHAAQNYGCEVTTTTISEEQYQYMNQRFSKLNLNKKINLLNKDYRSLSGNYDKIVSIEMIEAVGDKFLGTFFSTCSKLLKSKGQMLLQSITMPDDRYSQYLKNTDFIQTYIFPGSCIPSLAAIKNSLKKHTNFTIYDIEDIAPHYSKTLLYWLQNFNKNESQIRKLGYDENFCRLWKYYLSYCAAGFQERYLGDLQILMNKSNISTY